MGGRYCIMLLYNFFRILECKFDGQYPNDTVFCAGFGPSNLECTNSKECCQIPGQKANGCYNMSVIEGERQ